MYHTLLKGKDAPHNSPAILMIKIAVISQDFHENIIDFARGVEAQQR
jgi:hypothetical protein